MNTEPTPAEKKDRKPKGMRQTGASEAVYGFGLLGAWIYYFTHATTFLLGLLGFFKGIVWPAMLVYEATFRRGDWLGGYPPPRAAALLLPHFRFLEMGEVPDLHPALPAPGSPVPVLWVIGCSGRV